MERRKPKRYDHLRNRPNGSCHGCKNRKISVQCPLDKSHRLCWGCVKKHGFVFNDLVRNVEEYWAKGCPICIGACTCANCKKKAMRIPTHRAGTASIKERKLEDIAVQVLARLYGGSK